MLLSTEGLSPYSAALHVRTGTVFRGHIEHTDFPVKQTAPATGRPLLHPLPHPLPADRAVPDDIRQTHCSGPRILSGR